MTFSDKCTSKLSGQGLTFIPDFTPLVRRTSKWQACLFAPISENPSYAYIYWRCAGMTIVVPILSHFRKFIPIPIPFPFPLTAITVFKIL